MRIPLLVVLLLSFMPFTFGQELERIEQFQMLSSTENFQIQSPNANGLFIEQIGNNNSIRSVVDADESLLNYLQLGNNNHINVHANVRLLEENIIQQGNNNRFLDAVYNPSGINQMQLQQHGNGLILEKTGTNSLSEKMKIRMEGNNRTLIIRNF